MVKTGHTSVLVRNAFKQPLAELELGAIQASVRKPTPAVLQFYCGIQVSAWSFNSRIAAWEPVLESWDLIVKVDANSGSTVRHPCDLPASIIDSRLACPHTGFFPAVSCPQLGCGHDLPTQVHNFFASLSSGTSKVKAITATCWQIRIAQLVWVRGPANV